MVSTCSRWTVIFSHCSTMRVTAALSRARTSADSREEMGREMARLAERKAAVETEYDQTVAKLWDEMCIRDSGYRQPSYVDKTNAATIKSMLPYA